MTTSTIFNLAHMSRSIAALLLAALLPLIASGQGMNDIQWLSSVDQAKQIARQQDKMVLLHFDATWCRPCKALETYVFKSGAVKKAIAENVVPVRLDADTALNLVNEYDVSMVPFDVIITPGGRVITERRSPADAENYAKMISGVATANRMLEKEKLGPIAHQRKIVNKHLNGQNPTDFRVSGPKVEPFGLSKDSSMLQRRQTAFSESTNSVRKKNPWINGGQGSAQPQAQAPPMQSPETVSVSDLQRNEFLNRERTWSAPQQQTRRAKPERIVNERYFESLAKKSSSQAGPAKIQNQFAMPSNETPASAAIELPMAEPESAMTSPGLEMPTAEPGISSGQGEFKAPTAVAPSGTIVDVSVDSPDLLDLQPETPEIVTEKFGLKGKCPVTLITEGRWADGDTDFGIVHRNRTYIFASAEKLALFRTDPDKYSPILAGYDPVVYHDQGKLVEGLAENGVFMGRTPNQKVILFSNDETRSKFQSSPQMYLETIRIATMNARTRKGRTVR